MSFDQHRQNNKNNINKRNHDFGINNNNNNISFSEKSEREIVQVIATLGQSRVLIGRWKIILNPTITNKHLYKISLRRQRSRKIFTLMDERKHDFSRKFIRNDAIVHKTKT